MEAVDDVTCARELCSVSVPADKTRDFGFVTVSFDHTALAFCSLDCATDWFFSEEGRNHDDSL